MRLALAARGLHARFTGPNEVIYNMIRGLLQYWPENTLYIFYDKTQRPGLFPQAHEIVLSSNNRLLWDHLYLPLALHKTNCDIAIFPKGAVSWHIPCPFVVLIYDLGYFHPALNAYKTFETIYMKIILRYAAQKAFLIWAISEFTRQEVLNILGVPPSKVHTIHLAPDPRYKPITNKKILEHIRKKYNLQRPFIFYPTSISPRKNIRRLLYAFKSLLSKIPHHLYLTGGIAWKHRTEKRLLSEPDIAQRVHLLGQVPPEDMPALYSLAEFVVYPSLFEGFGLPIVEAFRCGTPVLTSKSTSLPEVAGEAALFVDPYDVSSIEEGILRLATDSELRARLRILGFQQMQKFSWKKTISKMRISLEKACQTECG